MKKKHLILMKTMLIALAVIVVSGACPIESKAQQQNPFVLIECMKVTPENEGLYLEVERDIWKPIHQERVKQGKILGWILYRIHYTASSDEYNYATATIFADPANLENPYEGIDFEKMVPEMDVAWEKTSKSRELVKKNLIRQVVFAYPENSTEPAPFKYIEVNYMKTKPGSGYLGIARNIWQPVHQEFVNAGSRAGWGLWSSVYPSGTEADFQFVAVNYYSDFSKLGTANFAKAFKKAHPNLQSQTEMSKARESRDLVRRELWEVVDRVMMEQ